MKVSVIIPVYNAEKYIERCLDSIRGQSLDDYELIIVDDRSTDDSWNVINSYLNKYPSLSSRTVLLRNEENSGSSATRTVGLNAARGEYVIQVDSDDFVAANYLEKLVETADRENADITICEYYYVRDEIERKQIKEPVDKDCLLSDILSGEIHGSLWNKLLKRSIVEEYNIRPLKGVDILDDKSMIYKVVYYATSVAYVHSPLYYYNIGNPDSYTSRPIDETVKKAEQGYIRIVCDMHRFFAEHPVRQNVRDAFDMFRAFILGLLLIHGNYKVVNENSHLFNHIKWHLISQAIVPSYYKVMVAFYKIGLGRIACLLNKIRSLLK